MKKSYSPNVLIGNWWEERIIKKEENKYNAEKAIASLSSSELLQFLSKYQPDKIECSSVTTDGYLRFGSKIQILNPGSSPYYIRTRLALPRPSYTVSLGIDNSLLFFLYSPSKHTSLFDYLSKENMVKATASPGIQPVARNVFEICSARSTTENQIIRYGDAVYFVLKIGSTLSEETLKYLSAEQNIKLYLASDFEQLGEQVIQPGAQKLFFEFNQPSFLSQWHIEAANPNLRSELNGLPVKFDEKVIIKHERTNKALALEPKVSAPTIFGNELSLSARTYFDSHKLERDVNIWILASARMYVKDLLDISSTDLNTDVKTCENASLECDIARQTVDLTNVDKKSNENN